MHDCLGKAGQLCNAKGQLKAKLTIGFAQQLLIYNSSNTFRCAARSGTYDRTGTTLTVQPAHERQVEPRGTFLYRIEGACSRAA
jgi:hypothetical protein